MGLKTFTRQELRDVLYEDNEKSKIISDRIIENSRWSILHELIFRFDDMPEDEAWRVSYTVGATEQQDESPWEYEETDEATLVRRVEKLVKVWETAQ